MRILLTLAFIAAFTPAVLRAEPIVNAASGEPTSLSDLLDAARQADFVLLGEVHDNIHHHRLRAQFIRELAPDVVIAEHLEQGRQARWQRDSTSPTMVIDTLTEAGFDGPGWQWPLHAPLFEGLARAGIPVLGGNISRDLARRLVREGSAALPATLATTLDKAPLPRTAQATLDADLLESHCGQLPASRVPGMRLAQRARDAAMATTLLDLNRKPALLVAGNGHVRTDYGVPVLLSELRPGARILSIGFLEEGRSASDEKFYTYIWRTPPASRDDPCASMKAAKAQN